MEPLRIALVGFGKIARDAHVPAIAETEGIELAAIVDPASAGAAIAPVFSDLAELADSALRIDAVALCTPPAVRARLAVEAMERGWHVLLEKPPAVTLQEVVALRTTAADRGVTAFAAWHSRFADAVEPARAWLIGRTVKRISLIWKENIRHFHPGQDWILAESGFGVFDPAINGLSVLTRVLPGDYAVTHARFAVPSNRQAPVAAQLQLHGPGAAPVSLDLDFLQEGQQFWHIAIVCDDATLTLDRGGQIAAVDGQRLDFTLAQPVGEYARLYSRFCDLVTCGDCEIDDQPLKIVSDAFAIAQHESAPAFEW